MANIVFTIPSVLNAGGGEKKIEISVFFSPPPAFSTEGIVNVIFAISIEPPQRFH